MDGSQSHDFADCESAALTTEDVQRTRFQNDHEGDGDSEQLIQDTVDPAQIDLEFDHGVGAALADYIRSGQALERDITHMIYNRVFEMIPFLNSYADLKP